MASVANAQEPVELELGRCLPLSYGTTTIITDQNGMWSAIRNDASRDNCIIEIQKLNVDLAENVLVGTNINSGFCGRPPGLAAELETDHESLTATVKIRFDNIGYERCAAMSSFVYWIAVTKPPQGFTIKVDVGPRQINNKAD